ncbi:unnamed protein product [Camellia sinensis]
MASSQVEIASSTPFGCVLRNRWNRETKTQSPRFQQNLKDLVSCISSSSPVENSSNVDVWVREEDQRESSPTQSDGGSVEIPNLGGVSSLVRKWRVISESRTSQSAAINIPNSSSSPVEMPPLSRSETCESVDEKFGTPSPSVMTEEESFLDWESETMPSRPPSARGKDSVESERLRVADVIRKLTSVTQIRGSLMTWKNDHDRDQQQISNESLPRLNTGLDDHQQQPEHRCFSPRIRGRLAFNELLLQLERNRVSELDSLVERRAVSKFSHRGRIQAMLRLRFLREAAMGYQQHSRLMPIGVQHHWHREAAPAIGSQQPSCRAAEVENQQNLRHEAPMGGLAAQQHSSHSTITGVKQHSTLSTTTRVQQHSCCETAGESKQHSNSTEVGTPQHLHPHEADVGAQQHLFREEAIRDQQHLHSLPTESNRPTQGSVVVLLREKFNVRVESDATNLKIPRGVVENNVESFTSSQLRQEPHHLEVNTTEQQSTFSEQDSVAYTRDNVHEEATRNSHNIWQQTRYEICNLESQKSEDRPTSSGWDVDVNTAEQEANNEELIATNQDSINDVSDPQNDWEEEEANNQQQMGNDQIQDWLSVISHPWTEWEEQEVDNQQLIGMSHDWIGEVSRPRSDWEGLRQARYQEMLDPYMENEDIRQLLERRSVSTFLSSSLRAKMDQLMISRVQGLPYSIGNQQEEEEEESQGIRNRLEQLMMSRLQREKQLMSSLPEEEEEEEEEEQDIGVEEEELEADEKLEEDEEEEEVTESSIGHQCSEVSDYEEQMAAVRSWSGDGDSEVSYDSDRTSPSPQQTQSSESSYSDAQPHSSFTNRSSIEMELIYDLRGHMEQLHREISELRKSIKSCVNMQVKLQRSMKQEVSVAVSSSVPRVGRKSRSGAPRKGSCCVCYEMKVDSLLYRCGHMCTCFKCAHELLWSSGKCPICRAPIVDVVRAYANDS